MHEKPCLLYFLAILTGLLTGTIASYFQISIVYLDTRLSNILSTPSAFALPGIMLSALLSAAMVGIAWLAVKFIAPQAQGSGVPQIEGALMHINQPSWKKLLPVKFIGGLLAISAKMVLGREGPTIQMGGNVGAMLSDCFYLSPQQRDTLIAAGAAAGLAAAFNAPLAGVLFVMEEMHRKFDYSLMQLIVVIMTCVAATIMLHLLLGTDAAIQMHVIHTHLTVQSLWVFILFGMAVGFLGLTLNRSLILILNQVDNLSLTYQFLYTLSIAAIIGCLAYIHPQCVGSGYAIINQALTALPAMHIILSLAFIRFITTLVSYSTNVPGGIFAPMMAIGTLFGLAGYQCVHWLFADLTLEPGIFALAGMSGLFAASVGAPITGVILVIEMTKNYSLILPLMLTCMVSCIVMQAAKNKPIYTQLLERNLCQKKKHTANSK